MTDINQEFRHRVYIGTERAHYPGNMMAGAGILGLVTDASTEWGYLKSGKSALLAAIKDVSFLQPVYSGETLEIVLKPGRIGNRSRETNFEVYKYYSKEGGTAKAVIYDQPLLVSKGVLVGVVPKD